MVWSLAVAAGRQARNALGQELTEATVADDRAKCAERCRWVQRKQLLLDDEHEMVWDKPSMENGREKEFGALGPDATRVLTNPLERGHES